MAGELAYDPGSGQLVHNPSTGQLALNCGSGPCNTCADCCLHKESRVKFSFSNLHIVVPSDAPAYVRNNLPRLEGRSGQTVYGENCWASSCYEDSVPYGEIIGYEPGYGCGVIHGYDTPCTFRSNTCYCEFGMKYGPDGWDNDAQGGWVIGGPNPPHLLSNEYTYPPVAFAFPSPRGKGACCGTSAAGDTVVLHCLYPTGGNPPSAIYTISSGCTWDWNITVSNNPCCSDTNGKCRQTANDNCPDNLPCEDILP